MIEFIKRENYVGRDRNEVIDEFQKIVDDYAKQVDEMTVEQCKEEEKALMELMNQHEKIMADVVYELPKSITFKGSNTEITRKTVGNYICELLEKVECEYQYTLGYYELFLWWKKPAATINYNTLNSTLQVLGSGLRFRGPHQWQLILSINEFFKPLHNDYIIDNSILHTYANIHSKLLDKMQLNTPVTPTPTASDEGTVE